MLLIVDDDKLVVKSLIRVLKKKYQVEAAYDGVKAFKFLKSSDCKCIILDIKMPRINGIEFLMLMQAEGIKVPVIVIAGFPDFTEKEIREFPNVVKFFHKPFEIEEMLDTVKKYALN
jgi:DNA-binding NtrC family response regulator